MTEPTHDPADRSAADLADRTAEFSHSDMDLAALPLSDMERLHWLQHTPQTPNIIGCHLKFRGVLERTIVESVIKIGTRQRHVLLNARLDDSGRGGSWQTKKSNERDNSLVRWHNAAYDRDTFAPPDIDLSQQGAVSCDVFQHQGHTDMLWQIHHAATDGIGGMQLIGEFLKAYDNLAQGKPYDDGLRRLDTRLLAERNRLGLFSKGFWKRLHVQWIPLFGACKFALNRIVPLLPEPSTDPQRSSSVATASLRKSMERDQEDTAEQNVAGTAGRIAEAQPSAVPSHMFGRYISASLPPEMNAALRAEAARQQATPNELLLAAMFTATANWQRAQGIERGNRKIRVLVPLNLRELHDRRLPACNRMSFVQLDRGERDLRDLGGLTWGINYELGIIRKYRFGTMPNLVLRGLFKLPGDKSKRLRNQFRATTLLSNVGWPLQKIKLPSDESGQLQVGGNSLLQANLIAPFYSLSPVTFLVAGYAGKLNVTLNYNPTILTSGQAKRYMTEFVASIHLVAGVDKAAATHEIS